MTDQLLKDILRELKDIRKVLERIEQSADAIDRQMPES